MLSPTFLFRYSAPCRYRRTLGAQRMVSLSDKHVLPCFGELEGKELFADVRAAWNKQGLLFAVEVVGKRQAPWCRSSRLEDSDGFQVWIDTRDAHDIHRATRFCHRFVFLPSGGRTPQQPYAQPLPIHRAKGHPNPVDPNALSVLSERRRDGYRLQAYLPAAGLTSFDPDEHPRLGFTYAVVDRELGWQTFSVPPEFPFAEDPSLWGTLELVP